MYEYTVGAIVLRKIRLNEYKKLKRKKLIPVIIIAIFLVIVGIIIGHRLYENNRYEDILSQMEYIDNDSQNKRLLIDFSYLSKINSDIYSWIDIPGSSISYPVLQREDGDDEYYLNHNLDKTLGYPGVIYSHSVNKKDYSDRVTILYGHNMRNGSMFGELQRYKDTEYFDSHQDIYIHTKGEVKHYKVFAALTHDDSYIVSYYNGFKNESDILAFYSDSMSNAINKNYSYIVNADSKILVLSTCEKDDTERFLLEAVLVDFI